jgi:hypothetical protein
MVKTKNTDETQVEQTSDLSESNTTTLSHFVVRDNVWCNGKRYEKGDVFDAEITDLQLVVLLDNGVVAKHG